MIGSPRLPALRERDADLGQLGLALEDLQAGFAAKLDQPETPGGTTTPGRPAAAAQVLDLAGAEVELDSRLSDLEHPVTAYLNGLATSSRRPQLSALDWIARRSTQVYGL